MWLLKLCDASIVFYGNASKCLPSLPANRITFCFQNGDSPSNRSTLCGVLDTCLLSQGLIGSARSDCVFVFWLAHCKNSLHHQFLLSFTFMSMVGQRARRECARYDWMKSLLLFAIAPLIARKYEEFRPCGRPRGKLCRQTICSRGDKDLCLSANCTENANSFLEFASFVRLQKVNSIWLIEK